MKHTILYLFVATALLSACDDDLENKNFTISDEVPAATYLKENGYTEWVSLLEYTDLYNTINLSVGDYTLFIPENEAVTSYLEENGYSSVSEIDPDYARLLVKYHTIAGNQYSKIDFSNDVLPDTTATGDRLTVTFDEEGDYWVNNESMITHFDIEASNATIFVIDKMLTPVTEYIYDRFSDEEYSDWTIFKQVIDATGLASLVQQPVAGRAASYTMFVVPDDVYRANRISSLSVLADSLGAGQDRSAWTESDNAMYRYAAYHLLSSSYSTNDFIQVDTFSVSSTVYTLETVADAAYLEFQDINGTFYINYDSETDAGVHFVSGETNILCKNGMIHAVDDPLYIKAPSSIPSVTWELTDYSVLSTEISNYRLSSLLSPYSDDLSDLKEKYGDDFCYNWYTPSNSRNPVSYYVGTSNDSIGAKFKNHDALEINLGQYGYIEMESPTILADENDSTTYAVGLSYYHDSDVSQGGLMTIYIDDVKVGTFYSRGGTNGDCEEWVVVPNGSKSKNMIGTITFATTQKHILKIEDNKGSNVKLDYILFYPQ